MVNYYRHFVRRIVTAVILASIFFIASSAAALPAGAKPIVLKRPVRGAEAISVLGQRLARVARDHKMSGRKLRRDLRTDSSLWVARDLALFYVERELTAANHPAAASMQTALMAAQSYPLADTFKMHSKLGSKRIIYIDFDGHDLSGTVWSSYTNSAPPWDIDGNPSTFNDAERTRIQGIWARVAEDYAQFDVDVTTELTSEAAITRSSSSDEYYGTRALVSPISSYVGNYGGIAYVGVFDYVGDYYKPALIFPEKLSNGEKYIAEAVSHEVGHNLGLSHDGTTAGVTYYQGHGSGETGWAQIMGNGYYKYLTQWSKGEYPGANNTQDDIAVIQTNGLALRADDHGDSSASATALSSSSFGAAGLITTGADADFFRFSSGEGTVTLDLKIEPLGPNLDASMIVKNSSGQTVAAVNPAEALTASLAFSATAGIYFVSIEGVGKGDLATGYSDYASVGQYTITGTVSNTDGDFPPAAVIEASTQKGEAPLAVQFRGSSSSDVDGMIVSYAWDFGDGSSSTSSNPVVQHTYTAAGAFTARVSVTDNRGGTSSASAAVQVQQEPEKLIKVAALNLAIVNLARGRQVQATVTVQDLGGRSISGAKVTGSWTGLVRSTASASTNASGNAVLSSKSTTKKGTMSFKVTAVSLSGYTYDAAQNTATTASIVLP